jgi:hypothetical protein
MSSVVRERDDGSQCWCQIRFDSGERVLISIAGKPSLSVTVFRLAFVGLIPIKKIWELNEAKAGGHDAAVRQFMKMFPDENDALRRPLEDIRDTLLQCSSIEEARKLLLEREAALSG